MSQLHYPQADEYQLPRKNVLVLSCIDLRLTDNLLDFLNFDNLQNRYDHFIMAGTSLMCTKKRRKLFRAGQFEQYAAHWRKTMKDHLGLAIALHQVKDVYIIEHQDCGAYANFLDPDKVELDTLKKEKKWHRKFAVELSDELHRKVWTELKNGDPSEYQLGVHCFFIDLRGNVELLHTVSAKHH